MIFSQAQKEIQGKFEGGVSFDIDWSDLFHEGAKILNQNINPRSTKRRVPLYGGLSAELPVLTCPTDISKPAALYIGEQSFGGRVMRFQAPQAFFESVDSERFTIDYINGIPFIFVRTSGGATFTLQDFSDPDDFSGVALASTQRSYLFGSNALYGTFTDTSFAVNWSFAESQDLSLYGRGVALIPFSIPDYKLLESVTLKLRTDATNFFYVASTQDSIGDTFINGWNLGRFDLINKQQSGSPVISNINSAILEIKMLTGQTQEVIIDKCTLHQTTSAHFEYYSTKIFKNSAGSYLAKPVEDNDLIDLPDEEMDILIYEVCRLVVQNATYDGIDSKESQRFDLELNRKYEMYNRDHPSSQMPVTYNISSELPKEFNIENS